MTAAFIDDLRAAFGREEIDFAIRRGMGGKPGWFHARECGHEVGTPFEPAEWVPAVAPPKVRP